MKPVYTTLTLAALFLATAVGGLSLARERIDQAPPISVMAVPTMFTSEGEAIAFPIGPGPEGADDVAAPSWEAEDSTEWVLRVMQACKPRLSAARVLALADVVGRVAVRTFSEAEHRRAFASLVCIESRFEAGAKSPVGAVGLAQVMPQYAQEFAADCGLPRLEPGDVEDPLVNLQLGACRFRALLREFDGNVALALAGYNSGAGSSTTRRLAAGGNGVDETNGYLARHYVLTQKLSSSDKRED